MPLVAVVVVRVLHDVAGRLPPLVAAALVFAVMGGISERALTIFGTRWDSPLPRLATDLVVRFKTLMPPGPVASGGPVVLLTIDTLRSDHAVNTKTWAFLAERGATWDRAMTTASWTVPSVGSLGHRAAAG